MLVGIAATGNVCVAELLFGVPAYGLQSRDAVNRIDSQTEAIDLVVDSQLHRRVDVAFLFVSTHMEILVLAGICEAMDQPGIPVEIENDLFVAGE
jgi:hypothetical protein